MLEGKLEVMAQNLDYDIKPWVQELLWDHLKIPHAFVYLVCGVR